MQRVREQFGVAEFVMVGDRGMLSHKVVSAPRTPAFPAGASPTSRIRDLGDANPLIDIGATPQGLHYTEVAASAWAVVILGGGWAGSSRWSRSSSSFSSRSGSV